MGLASEKKGLCIESSAHNLIASPKYVPEHLQGRSIDSRYPHGAREIIDLSNWNLPRFFRESAKQGIPVMDISQDAGGFCCNQLLFQLGAARKASVTCDPPSIFYMHFPCTPESVQDPEAFRASGKILMPIDQIEQSLKLLLEGAEL